MYLYKKYLNVHIQSLLAYKISFLLTAIGQFIVSFNVFLGIYFMFQNFSTVNGYTFEECLLCYSIVLFSFSVAECFFRGFDQFASIIGNGEFDRMMVRPQNLILQVLGSKIELTRFGRLFQALVMLFFGINRSSIQWNGLKVFTLLLMMVGGTVIFACLFVIFASICFFTLDGLEIFNILTDGAREYGKYPLDIYGENILKFATYIVPFALIQYYPLQYLLGREENIRYLFYPLLALLFVLPTVLLWKQGVRHYKSTGS